MNLTNALIGLALYLLIWEKLPTWGTWFNALLSRLPNPLQTLYEQWRCPYCVGFWMALVLHALTGLWTLPALATMPDFLGPAALPIGWFCDALVTGTFMLVGKLALDAIAGPAINGHKIKDEMMKSLKEGGSGAAKS
ncbi:MAG: hypothetical protein AAF414_13000 [Pseudomonadota bacterium]